MGMVDRRISPEFAYSRLPGTFHAVLAGHRKKSQEPLGMKGQPKPVMREE